MNWTEVLTNLGIFTVGSISITGLLAFFGKRLFEQYLQRKLDDYRHELQLTSQEHEIQYTKLHNDRAVRVEQGKGTMIRILGEDIEILLREKVKQSARQPGAQAGATN